MDEGVSVYWVPSRSCKSTDNLAITPSTVLYPTLFDCEIAQLDAEAHRWAAKGSYIRYSWLLQMTLIFDLHLMSVP